MELCPVGSATSFPLELQEDFSKIISRNDPPLYQNTAELSKSLVKRFSRSHIKTVVSYSCHSLCFGIHLDFNCIQNFQEEDNSKFLQIRFHTNH